MPQKQSCARHVVSKCMSKAVDFLFVLNAVRGLTMPRWQRLHALFVQLDATKVPQGRMLAWHASWAPSTRTLVRLFAMHVVLVTTQDFRVRRVVHHVWPVSSVLHLQICVHSVSRERICQIQETKFAHSVYPGHLPRNWVRLVVRHALPDSTAPHQP